MGQCTPYIENYYFSVDSSLPSGIMQTEKVTITASRASTQTKPSHELEHIPEIGLTNLPVNLPEFSATDVSNSPVQEENTNLCELT